jgi:hypothetical protein
MSAPIDGKVYFAGCYAPDGYDMRVVKIGCAGDPAQRVQSVQTGQPFDCRLLTQMPGDMFMEYFIHMWLRSDHISGEYFHHRGKTADLIRHVISHGTHPFSISWTAPDGWFRTLDLVQFMDRHAISLKDIRKAAGVTCAGYETLLKKERCGNRRFLAALAVTAVRRGIRLNWPADFRPEILDRAA